MVQFQVISWDARDIQNKYTITMYGRTSEGSSVALSCQFQPYYFLRTGNVANLKGYKTRYLEAKDLWGFQNGKKQAFVQLIFDSLADFKKSQWNRKNVYEGNIDPFLRFMHCTGIQSAGWIDTGNLCIPAYTHETNIDLWCQDWRTLKPVDRSENAPIRILSLDIECYSADGSFPDPEKITNVVFQIGMTTKVRDEITYRKCLCVKESDGHTWFKTEREMLEYFSIELRSQDPDVVTGWNIFGFDLEYLFKRMAKAGCSPESYVWGRNKLEPVSFVEKKLASGALGSNILKLVPMTGRYVMDLFHEVKKEHKFESYSLNNVSKQVLKDQKNDMPVKEIFRRFEEADSGNLAEVAEYCIQDTILPHKLMTKLRTMENMIEMAKATWVPLSYLSERGQQIKVFSQIARKARELGFLIPTIPYKKTEKTEKYEGATVLEAQTGAYYGPITALDFASLYPSIMVAHNLCYSTLVMDPKYDNLPGVVYEQFGPHRFAQSSVSLLPAILTELKQFRKKAKRLMAEHIGTPLEAIYNGQQLAYKMSMNSVYGFTGATGGGMLPLVAIASTVTMRGRQMIEESKNYVESHFEGAKVRYGDTDSIMVEFDVQGRKGQDAIDYSWSLGEVASKQCTALFKEPNELELEKVYCPYFLYSKKRYAAKMYEKKGSEIIFQKIDIKGLQVVRRDNCPYVRDVCQTVLELIMNSSDPRPAIDHARQAAKELLTGHVPIEKLIMSKQLAGSYKNNNLAHVVVRDKMKERAPGSEPKQGDRVQYVIVSGPKKARLYEKSEDPEWVKTNKIKLDYEYYFTNQLKVPVCDLLEPLIGDTNIFDAM
jgi:DNA polymerase delta subunit 1